MVIVEGLERNGTCVSRQMECSARTSEALSHQNYVDSSDGDR